MTTFLFSLGVVVWVGIGVLNYGAIFGEFNSTYPWIRTGYLLPVMSLIMGPLGLFANLLGSSSYNHLEWGPRTKEQRYKAFQEDFPGTPFTIDNFEDPNKWDNI